MAFARRATDILRSEVAHVSKRLVFSYILDWVIILLTAVVGGIFYKINPNKHPFSLQDPNISFPNKPDTVTTATLLLVSLVAPAAIIALVCLFFVPGPTAEKGTPKSLIWRRKIWEMNTGGMGLGIALAGAFLVTEGMKDLYGKPRPDFLALCNPDLTNIPAHTVGGLGGKLDEAPIIVAWTICKNTGSDVLQEGFASFPSGHSSFSWAGMTYLTLFLCSKFAIAIPFLTPRPFNRNHNTSSLAFSNTTTGHHGKHNINPSHHSERPLRNQAAAPPTYLLILAFIPIGTAIFISASRWSDFKHQGFDIIFGSLIGFVFGWFGFRWYHLPIRQGAGWSWGARTREKAFGVGVGIPSYVGEEGWSSSRSANNADLESGGQALTSGGMADTVVAREDGGVS